MPGKVKAVGTPTTGNKGKMDAIPSSQTPVGKKSPKALSSKANTPATTRGKKPAPPAQQLQTPPAQQPQTGKSRTPRGKQMPQETKKSRQVKTPVSGKGGKKKQAPVQQDSDASTSRKDMVDSEDDSEDDTVSEDNSEENDVEDENEDQILQKIRALRKASNDGKGQKEQPGTTHPPLKPKHKLGAESEEHATAGAASEARDKCTLFMKNLPTTVTISEIKGLSKEIKEVRLRIAVRAKRREKKMGFAYLEFSTEAATDRHHKILQGAKIGQHEVVVDYVGEKSNYVSTNPKKELVDPDLRRLYITGFSGDVKEADLRKLFPKATEISLPLRKKDKTPVGYAFAAFANEQQCKAAHEKCQGAKLHGQNLVVLFAKKRSLDKQKDQKSKKSEEEDAPPAKQAKLKDSENEDDQDDEEDEEDSDEDGEEDFADDDDDDDDNVEDDDDEDDDDDDDDE